jgi:hypothetical protein
MLYMNSHYKFLFCVCMDRKYQNGRHHGHCFKKSLKIPKGGNQNPYVEDGQTIQCPKEKVQKDKQHWNLSKY